MAAPVDELKLPKIPVTVELAMAGEAPRAVELYVAEHQARAFRRQHLLDLFESSADFLPAHDPGDDRWCVFNKAAVVWAGVPLSDGQLPVEEAPEVPEAELYEYRRDVRVELRGAGALVGAVMYSLPAEHARLADYLNQAGRFLRLWTTDRLYLVNKSYVLRVVEAVPAGE